MSLLLSLLRHQTTFEKTLSEFSTEFFPLACLVLFQSCSISVECLSQCTSHQHTGEQMESQGCSLRTSRLGSPGSSVVETGSIPGLGTKIPHATGSCQKKKKRRTTNRLSLESSFIFVFERKTPSPFLMDTVYLRCNCHITLC